MKTNHYYQVKVSAMINFHNKPIMNKELQKINNKTLL